MARQTSRRMVRIARRLRRKMTLPEVLLWQTLKLADVNIRKQHPCGPFVVDFYCPAAKLVIEIEGIVHAMGDRPERDEERFAWLERKGYGVLRIPASEVLEDVGEVAQAIVSLCRDRGPSPSTTGLRPAVPLPMTASRPQGGFGDLQSSLSAKPMGRWRRPTGR